MAEEREKMRRTYSGAVKKIVAHVLAMSMCAVTAGLSVSCAGAGSAGQAEAAATTAAAEAASATTTREAVTAEAATAESATAESATAEATTAGDPVEAAAGAAATSADEAAAVVTASALIEQFEMPEYEPFFRIDRDDPDAWQEELDNVRFLTKGEYELEEFDEQEYAPEGFTPSTEGLDTLCISGSAEFSEGQFRELAQKLRELAGDRKIYVIDARQESHMLVNGISLSFYGYNNWANAGMTSAEVEAAEKAVFDPLVGTTVTVYGVDDNEKTESLDLAVTSLMTEKELVESEGFTYYRLASPDHSWPDEAAVEEFINFAKDMDPATTWLHFHCEAGLGRTGIYMAIYDMMKNPGLSFEDIMVRQAMTGSSYLPNERDYSSMADLYKLRAERIRQVYAYIQENHDTGYQVKWRDWLAQKLAVETETAANDAEVTETAAQETAASETESSGEEEESDFEGFFRIDRDKASAYEKKLSNVRFLTEGEYELDELNEKYGVPSDFTPSTEGMDTLNISGSAQFSEEQFRELAQEIRELAGDKKVYVIDTRQESHMMADGISFSWYGEDNCSNEGLSAAQVEAAEKALFEPLLGETLTAYGVKKNEKNDSMEIEVESLMTERELVESEGFTYMRFPVLDHAWTQNEKVIDDFIEFVKVIDMDNSWLHFHCHAGRGRTGTFMAIYEMMKDPDVPLYDIVVREAMTGSSYLFEEKDSDPSKSEHAFKAMRIEQIYEYIQENRDTNYAVKWSDWIAEKDAE